MVQFYQRNLIERQEMYVNFKGRSAYLYKDDASIVRQFRASADICNAQVSGDGNNAVVAITSVDGKTILYRADGTTVRVTRARR